MRDPVDGIPFGIPKASPCRCRCRYLYLTVVFKVSFWLQNPSIVKAAITRGAATDGWENDQQKHNHRRSLMPIDKPTAEALAVVGGLS